MHGFNYLEKGASIDQAKKALILLHGRGGTAQDILGLAGEFVDQDFYVAALQADHNTWYPYGFMAPEQANQPWLDSAITRVKQLLDQTSAKVGYENVYLMGFSQGACLTLEVAARFGQKMGGVIAFTGGLIGEQLKSDQYQGDFDGTKVYIGNSDNDPHVPLSRSESSRDQFEQMNAEVKLSVFPGRPHTVSAQEVKEVKDWIF